MDEPFEQRGIYGERAELYDRIYGWKDYEGEAAMLRDRLLAEGIRDGARLVDGACGTGSHLAVFRRWYDVAGFDQSPELLAVARRKLPEVSLELGDLTDFTLERPVEVFTCLFSAIGCVFPDERLQACARRIEQGLVPGGVALVEPWIRPEVMRDNTVGLHVSDEEIPKLVRMSTTIREHAMTTTDFHWMVGHADHVEHFEERHICWMATREELVAAFTAAGLDTRFEEPGPMGRGLLVAKKPGG